MLTFDFGYFLSVLPKVAEAVPFTVYVIVMSSVLSITVGALVSVVRIRKTPFLYGATEVWLSFVRSMPFVLLLFLMYFTVPVLLAAAGADLSGVAKETYVIATVVFAFAPIIAEVIRPAYFAVDRGQHEAALVFGFTPWQRVTKIIVPQMIPMLLPPMVNQVIEIVKDTSLMYMLGLMDIMGRANMLINVNLGRGKLENYIAVAILYWVVIAALTALMHRLSARHTKGFSGGGHDI